MNNEMMEKIQKEKEKMQRSIREAPKYFVDPEKRTFVSKSWGWEDWICNSELYCGKILFVKKGKKCSWHYHQKDETFFVISGKLHVAYSTEDNLENACEIILMPGDAFHVSPGLRHRFTGLLDTEFTEFSTQHSDEDTVRIIKGD